MRIIKGVLAGLAFIFIAIPLFLAVAGALVGRDDKKAIETKPELHASESGGGVSNEEAAPTKDADISTWRYSKELDSMTGQQINYAVVSSDDELKFGFPYAGSNTPTLTIRRRKEKTDVALQIDKGQFVCNIPSCTIRIRFDDGKPMDFQAAGSSDYDPKTIFILNSERFVKLTRKAKTVRIQATFYQEGSPTIGFRTEGLKWP